MAFRRAWLVVAASLGLSSFAHAQDVGKPPSPPANPNPNAPAAGDATASAATTTVPSGPTPNTGFTYGGPHKSTTDTAAPHPHARAHAHHASGPIATLPGFEMLPEGGSRLFVQLTANVQVAEKPVAGGITYILQGAHILKRNNENALVTVHFNTPVSRARLLPAGGDLHFVVELRQNVKPTWKLIPAKDGGAVLEIDFAGGDFLPHDAPPPASDDASKTDKPSAPETPKK
jgi:hypothetical protein